MAVLLIAARLSRRRVAEVEAPPLHISESFRLGEIENMQQNVYCTALKA
jgi:hypothetical protein